MGKYVTAEFLRERLGQELSRGKTQMEVAVEAGISRQSVSMSLSGRYPFAAKLAIHLGYRPVRESLFEKDQ
jgi:hypothetical protein